MKFYKSCHFYAMITIAFWSLAPVMTRLALRYFSAFSLGFLRYAVASAALLIVCIAIRMPLPEKRDIPWFIASGASGFFVYMIVFNIGTGYVTAATSGIMLAMVPVFTALLASVIFKERLAAYQWIAIGVEFAGIFILATRGSGLSVNIGILWLLSGTLLLSCYNLLQRKLTRTYSGLQSTTYSMFAGTLLLAIFSPTAVAEISSAPSDQILNIVVLGLPVSAIAYATWSEAFKRADRTSTVSNYMFITPFLTGALGYVLVGEGLELSTLAGGAVIIAGALLFNRDGLIRQKKEEEPEPDLNQEA